MPVIKSGPIVRRGPSHRTARIELSNGQHALIEARDSFRVRRYRWYATKLKKNHSQYAQAEIRGKRVYMQHLILKPKPPLVVDHIDGNGLNNSRTNLRYSTKSQDQYNRPGWIRRNTFKGIFKARYRKWECRISVAGEQFYLWTGRPKIHVARLYDYYARKYQGKFAYTNFKSQPKRWREFGEAHERQFALKDPERLTRLARASLDQRLGLPKTPEVMCELKGEN